MDYVDFVLFFFLNYNYNFMELKYIIYIMKPW